MGSTERAAEIQVTLDGGAGRRLRDAAAAGDFAVEIRSEADVERLVALVRGLLERAAQLEYALSSRVVIEQAKGTLAERFGIDPEAAFEVLRRAARNHRMSIHELAGTVVPGAETPPEIEAARGS